MLGANGTIGLIATNTIGQGDTRLVGLLPMVKRGAVIYNAIKSLPWPGDAAVAVSVIHLALGSVAKKLERKVLDEKEVSFINSRLRVGSERADPEALQTNKGQSFVGSMLTGIGFTLSPAARDELIKKDRRNFKRIQPYIGGEEVNSDPSHQHSRYAINFDAIPIDEAEQWPDLIAIVRELVKPERDRGKREAHRKYWWHYGDKRPALYASLKTLKRCVVTSRVSKHLMFSFQPTDRIFAESMYVFPFDRVGQFAILQSRIHEPWARLLSSSLEDRLRYAASDCFDTFPFPLSDPRSVIPELESAGERLYEARAKYMVETNQGLTQTYNKLKNADCHDAPIVALRELHVTMDRAVLATYGWSDIAVPPFENLEGADEKKALEDFQDEVIDRLFVLNEKRANEEKLKDAGAKGATKKKQVVKRKTKDSATATLPFPGKESK